MSKRASAAAEPSEATPIDLTAEYQSAEEVAAGAWQTITLPSGNPYRVKVSRAVGPHFSKTVIAVNRRWTKGGRRPLDRLSPEQEIERQFELAVKGCFHDFQRPVLIKTGGERVELHDNTPESRLALLRAMPDLLAEIDSLCGLEAQAFAETVAEVGEG